MKRIFLACFLLCSVSPVWAGYSATISDNHWARRPYVGAGFGGMAPVVNKSHHVWAGPGVAPDYYVSGKEISDVGLLLATAGVTWVTQNAIVPYYSFGLRYSYTAPFDVKGYIVPNSIPNNKNYFYQYRVNQQNIFATLKLDFSGWGGLMPYFIFGAGASINETSEYKERPIDNAPSRISPAFGSHTNCNLAYIAGIGLEYIFRNDIWVSAEYNYGDYGPISTSGGKNTTSQGGPNYSHATLSNKLTGQSLLVGLNYYLW